MSDDVDLRDRLARQPNLLIAVKVSTRASKSEVVGLAEDGNLRVRLAAVPEKGKANEELRALLCHYFGVSKNNVRIVSGERRTTLTGRR
ncbi:MAG: DUF167 domain-containing protein [Bryobacteraceae bacterium]